MFNQIALLDKKKHGNKKFIQVNSYEFTKEAHLISIVISEFIRAATTFPIIFIKKEEHFWPFAVTGLKAGENLFVDSEGKWEANYIPAILRGYPFILGKNSKGDEFRVCIDEKSPFISDEKGDPLFDEQGSPTEVIENAKKFLTNLQQFNVQTGLFCQYLSDKELLYPLTLQLKNLKTNAKPITITGYYGVNEKKFNLFSDKEFIEMRKRGFLPLIYAHLLSLSQMEKLALKHEPDE